ncbi:MAG TPA: cytochrome c biogenesis protein CcsA [Candidatus Paceibacterota bacterium]|nr:cytochrome c biogenesis protein CcsA [Verrucomicrobiota bacterium]HSA11163.1 cytochrome c biogenesis protein CcsA [Candidatus Paceibacterota bacterium]
MKFLLRLVPWFFVALFGAEIVAVFLPKRDGEYHVRAFGRLPVLLNGRIQPFDSVARNSLLQIRSTGDLPLEQVPFWKFWYHPKKLRATEWLLETATRPEVADTRPIFLIHHAELLGELKLQDKGIEKSGLRYYSFNDLKPMLEEIDQQARKAGEAKSGEQSTFQKQVLKLANALSLYRRLKFTLQPEGVDDFAHELAVFQQNLGAALAAAHANAGDKDFDRQALQRIARPLQNFRMMARHGYALTVPPLDSARARDDWQTLGASLLESAHSGALHPAATNFAALATAYRRHDAPSFNRVVETYRQWLAPRFDGEVRKGRAEYYFNNVKPFLHAMIIYLCAFVLAWGALLTFGLAPGWSEALRRSAFYLVLIAGLVHTFGLVFRMALEGRPPVTNLYSSAIFIGWGAMLLGLVLERIYRVGIGSVVASLAGFVTLTIAHNLALGGDTMEMLRAVLDTNFWLATHVITITLGYSAAFAAGLLAIIYIFLGVFTPLLSHPVGRARSPSAPPASAGAPCHDALPVTLGQALGTMVYGIICFTTLFSFVGTVLGGIWADQSWGRFWGWDPKENGALLIVLWNAIILHARWGNLLRDRGIMNLAVFGNVVTSFSWFGVNMLGIGLHSYGFMDAAFKWLMLFFASQVMVIVLGLLPLRLWRSYRAGTGLSSSAQPDPATV